MKASLTQTLFRIVGCSVIVSLLACSPNSAVEPKQRIWDPTLAPLERFANIALKDFRCILPEGGWLNYDIIPQQPLEATKDGEGSYNEGWYILIAPKGFEAPDQGVFVMNRDYIRTAKPATIVSADEGDRISKAIVSVGEIEGFQPYALDFRLLRDEDVRFNRSQETVGFDFAVDARGERVPPEDHVVMLVLENYEGGLRAKHVEGARLCMKPLYAFDPLTLTQDETDPKRWTVEFSVLNEPQKGHPLEEFMPEETLVPGLRYRLYVSGKSPEGHNGWSLREGKIPQTKLEPVPAGVEHLGRYVEIVADPMQ